MSMKRVGIVVAFGCIVAFALSCEDEGSNRRIPYLDAGTGGDDALPIDVSAGDASMPVVSDGASPDAFCIAMRRR